MTLTLPTPISVRENGSGWTIAFRCDKPSIVHLSDGPGIRYCTTNDHGWIYYSTFFEDGWNDPDPADPDYDGDDDLYCTCHTGMHLDCPAPDCSCPLCLEAP